MTLEEKIGQLFVVPAFPAMGKKHKKELFDCIDRYKIGGVILKATSLEDHTWLQELDPSLLVCIDAEWGLGMRMQDQISFPKNLTLGAVQDKDLLYEVGLEIGRQVKNFGAHLNLAPVVDVNNNPNNPIIHMRSFGEKPDAVAEKAHLVMQGMQDAGVFVCLKHFPGHGDTAFDSHLELPMIAHGFSHLEQIELYPFKCLTRQGVDFVMTAHLLLPKLDTLPATLSKKIVQGLLREQMGFQGLIITDALNMKALINHFSPGQIALLAHRAGHDLLLYGDHVAPNINDILHNQVSEAFEAIKQAYLQGDLEEKDLDAKVRKILSMKQKIKKEPFNPAYDFSHALALKRQLYRQAITLVRGTAFALHNSSCAYVSIVEKGSDPLKELFSQEKYSTIQLTADCSKSELEKSLSSVNNYSSIVVGLSIQKPLASHIIHQLKKLQKTARVVIALFGSPYLLQELEEIETIVLGYEQDPMAYEEVFAILQGKNKAVGQLPISISLPKH